MNGQNIKPMQEWKVNITRLRNLQGSVQNQLYSWSHAIKKFRDYDAYGKFVFKNCRKEKLGENLIKNGNFIVFNPRGIPGNWQFYSRKKGANKHSVSKENLYFRNGGTSVKISNAVSTIYVYQKLSLKPGRTYQLSFYIKADKLMPHPELPSAYYGAYVNIVGKKINKFFPVKWYRDASFPWLKQTFIFKYEGTDANSNALCRLTLAKTCGSVWFDDVKVREVLKP
jgi:hypothetical protein